jgi:hypothetical protein
MNTHKMLFVGIVLYLAGVVLTPWAMPDNLLISADFTWHTKSALICGLLAITAGFVIITMKQQTTALELQERRNPCHHRHASTIY